MNDEPTDSRPPAVAPIQDKPRGEPRPEPRMIARVRFPGTDRSMDCDSGDLVLRTGEDVVADDRRMGGLAKVVVGTTLRSPKGPVGRVIRRAEDRDREKAAQEKKRQVEVLAYARERARALNLPIKFFRVDLGQGGDRSLLFFSSEQRVDFRALVRDLASFVHGRIELRQVGVRDEAKMTGGIGSCGGELCCANHLRGFVPVSIKMAKNQHLVLNPTKIAGQCGRLKCCLAYEDQVYLDLGKGLPKTGKRVETPDGIGRVDDVDVLRRKIRVSFMDAPPKTYEADEVRSMARPQPGDDVTPEPVMVEKADTSDPHELVGSGPHKTDDGEPA